MSGHFRMVFFVLLAACLACSAPRGEAQIRIGLITPLSGAVPTFGASVRNGVDLAIQEWNDRGGIRGSRIEAVVEDGQCAADAAVQAVTTLINEEHIQYFIGEVCSSASIPVSEIANEAHVVQLTPTSTNRAVTVDSSGRTKPYVFRNCFIDSYQGTVAARFAYGRLGARTAFILRAESNDYASSICDTFAEEFQRLGGSITGDESYGYQTTDFGALLNEVAKSDSAIVCLPDYYDKVNLAARQAKRIGLSIPFIGGDGWDSSDLNAASAAGGYFVNHYSPDDPRPVVQDFVSAYKRAFETEHDPDALAALAYDAAQMMMQAIQDAGSDDATRVRDILEAIRFSGVTGVLTFDGSHNPVKTAVIMAVTPGGARFEADVDPQP
jgi:branched-chain amino acid transport system substrate-binding protein